MKALSRRPSRLEDQVARANEALHMSAVPPGPSAAEWFARKLDEYGIVRGPRRKPGGNHRTGARVDLPSTSGLSGKPSEVATPGRRRQMATDIAA